MGECSSVSIRVQSTRCISVSLRFPSIPIRFFSHLLCSFPFPFASNQCISISIHITAFQILLISVRSMAWLSCSISSPFQSPLFRFLSVLLLLNSVSNRFESFLFLFNSLLIRSISTPIEAQLFKSLPFQRVSSPILLSSVQLVSSRIRFRSSRFHSQLILLTSIHRRSQPFPLVSQSGISSQVNVPLPELRHWPMPRH